MTRGFRSFRVGMRISRFGEPVFECVPQPVREAPWMPVVPLSHDRAYEAILAPDCTVRVEMESVVQDPIALRARRWLIKSEDLSLTATWLSFGNMQFEMNDEPLALRWTKFPVQCDVTFPGGSMYRLDRSSQLQTALRTASGNLILLNKIPWKDSRTRAGVKWISEIQREPPDAYAGLAAGMLLVVAQIDHEAKQIISNGLEAFPEANKKNPPVAKSAFMPPPQGIKSIIGPDTPKSDSNEIPWYLADERPGIHVVRAEFPKGLVKVERLGQTIFNAYGRHTRCVVGDWIAAVENPAAKQPNVFSNAEDIALTVATNPDGFSISSATAAFSGGDSFHLSPHEVAGWHVTCNGRSIARHALPWKDSHQRARAQWVTYLEVGDYPWPGTGMALALFDILRTRLYYSG